MSPRQTRRGTIKQTRSTELNNQDRNVTLEQVTPKSKGHVTRRQTRQKKCASNEDEHVEKISKSTKKMKGEKSKKQRGHKKSANTLSNSDDNMSKNGLPECDQDIGSRPMLSNKVDSKNDLITPTAQKLDVTFTPEMPPVKQTKSDHTYTPTVTPKSSPIVVNLTPHRTTKTPRRSPVNLASPKTHSKAPQRLSKTPRKLSISANSPAPDEAGIPKFAEKSSESDREGSSHTSLDTAAADVSSKSKKRKKKVVSLRSSHAVRRFSKSPKIVLRSPKTKSRKSKSPKAVRGVGKVSPKKNTPQQKRGSLLPSPKAKHIHIAAEVMNTDSVMLSKLSPVQMAAFNNKPRVVLEKLMPTNKQTSKLFSDDKSSDQMIKTPVVHILAQAAESPRRPKSTGKKRSSLIDSDTPLRPIPTPKGSGSRKHIRKETLNATDATSMQLSIVESAPILSSTPRDKIRRLLNLTDSPRPDKSPVAGNSPALKKSKKENSPRSPKTGANATDKSICIEDVSQPFVNLSADRISENSEASNTYEIRRGSTPEEGNKTSNADNDTYEVLEPKTPSLQQKAKKRNTTDANLSSGEREQAKRVCKVRFASPVPQANNSIEKFTSIVTNAARASTPRKEAKSTFTPVSRNRRRSHSTTEIDIEKRTSTASRSKQRSVSSSRMNIKMQNIKKDQETPGNKSVNRSNCVSTEKKGLKTPLSRKVPNFAQIHEKKFAEMESLLDAKNRVQKRHLALTAVQTHSKPLLEHKKDLPTSTRNGIYNRFGFKIKKDDAKDIVLKKQPVQKMKSKQEENRTFIKGVRMNRRFELQMKSRNIKL